jgi:hypothetical protein
MSHRIYATPRLLLFFIVIIIKIVASALSAVGFVLNNAVLLITGIVAWLGYFVTLFMVAVPETDRLLRPRLRCLRTTALTTVIVILTVGIALVLIMVTVGLTSIQDDNPEGIWSRLFVSLDNVFGYNDATALSHQAAENVLHGKNPYAESNIVNAMLEYDGSIDKITPLREGRLANIFPYPDITQLERLWEDISATPEIVPPEVESRFNYPAGCFLLPAAFIWMGIEDFRIIYLILIVPAFIYIIWRVRSGLRLLLVGAIIISVELWYSLAAGETGYLYFPFLLMAWVLYKRNLWASALFMAGAVAIKQLTWFVFPFYLLLVWRTMGDKKALAVLLITAGVFVASNAAFIVSDPELWMKSVLSPMTENMFPIGVGIVTLVTGGVLDIHTALPFGILELIVLIAGLVWYFLNCRRYPHTGPVLAVLPLFFAWRSLWGYFFYIDIIILAAVMINEYGTQTLGENNTFPVMMETIETV